MVKAGPPGLKKERGKTACQRKNHAGSAPGEPGHQAYGEDEKPEESNGRTGIVRTENDQRGQRHPKAKHSARRLAVKVIEHGAFSD